MTDFDFNFDIEDEDAKTPESELCKLHKELIQEIADNLDGTDEEVTWRYAREFLTDEDPRIARFAELIKLVCGREVAS